MRVRNKGNLECKTILIEGWQKWHSSTCSTLPQQHKLHHILLMRFLQDSNEKSLAAHTRSRWYTTVEGIEARNTMLLSVIKKRDKSHERPSISSSKTKSWIYIFYIKFLRLRCRMLMCVSLLNYAPVLRRLFDQMPIGREGKSSPIIIMAHSILGNNS